MTYKETFADVLKKAIEEVKLGDMKEGSDKTIGFNLYTESFFKPARIIRSGTRGTVVFWENGDKTVVKRKYGSEDDKYSAFLFALAKHIYGSNGRLNKIIEMTEPSPFDKKVAAEKAKAMTAASDCGTHKCKNHGCCIDCPEESDESNRRSDTGMAN